MKYIGAHVSIAGGVEFAPLHAAQIGATGFALFTKNQLQWRAKALTPEEIAAFQANCRAGGFAPEAVLPHDSYLINLGQPDLEKRKNAQNAFIAEMQRVEALGLVYLNFHPGSGVGLQSDEDTMKAIAEGIRMALAETDNVTAVIENTAGQGSVVGHSFAQLARLIELVNQPERTGVCIDTCHAYAAGYDWLAEDGYDRIFAEFEREIGFGFLRGMHLNDTKGKLDSHLDRHDGIGKGLLGSELFTRLMRDPRIDNIPMILETPDESAWPTEIAWLKSQMG